MTIWFATGNLNKKAELAAILNDQGINCDVLIPQDAGFDFNPEETGTSFHENALLKARELYSLLSRQIPQGPGQNVWRPGDPVIADDSGICLDALNGRPGIFSARYAGARDPMGKALDGEKLKASERNALLLAELGDKPRRTARFVCAMVLLFDPDRFFLSQETCEGEIVKDMEHARGTGGFGYDPILYLGEFGKTVAELSEETKNRISHRGKAGKNIAAILRA